MSDTNPRAKRVELWAELGDPADEYFAEFACPKCGGPAEIRSVGMVHPQVYRGLKDIVRQARWSTESEQDRLKKRGASCRGCDGQLVFVRLHLHVVDVRGQRDLVVTFEDDGSHALCWWSGEGQTEPADPSDDDLRPLLRERCHKALGSNLGLKMPDATERAFRTAVELFPDDETVLELLPSLVVSLRKRGFKVGSELARGLVERSPDSVAAAGVLGAILLQGWGDGHATDATLGEAVEVLRKAVELAGDAGDVRAELTLCTALRQQKKDPEAREALKALIARFPEVPEAHYNLGVLELDACTPSETLGIDRELRDVAEASADALASFEAGAALAPTDPDFAVGRARALTKLQRYDEARAAAARARELGSTHPRLDQVEVEIQRALSGGPQGELGTVRVKAMGGTVHGEGITEQGSIDLTSPEDVDGQALRLVEEFCARLKMVKAVASTEGPGDAARFYMVMGNGMTCRAQPVDAPDQLEAFLKAFDERWAMLGRAPI